MGDGNSQYFDLPTLLRLGDINFLKVSRNDLSLQVGEFYNLLSTFEQTAQTGIDALTKIAALEAKEQDINNLTTIKDLLVQIGGVKVIPPVEETLKTVKRGRFDAAAEEAKKTLEEYNKLLRRIRAAKKEEKPDAGEEGGSSAEDFKMLLIKDAILRLEQEEASRKLRILAVDDAPVMIKTISSVLDDEYKVYGMTNPTMLEKFLGQITPELFLLDYQMPEINGFELVPMIREYEEHKDTPIIFLTSMGTIEHISAAMALGACDFIVKPFKGENLKEKVAKHIVRKKLLF